MESLFKVGDIVTIKPKYDPGCEEHSYRRNFTKTMLEVYGGKHLKVIRVYKDEEAYYTMPDDGFVYILKSVDTDVPTRFSWASSMFKSSDFSKKYPNLF